jgi:hypothetical protein
MKLHVLGIYLGKTVFHLVGLDSTGRVVTRKRCSRTQLLAFTAQNVVVVALANMLVRMVCAVLCKNECYRAPILAVTTKNPCLRKKFLPGLLEENRDGNESLSGFRNPIPEKVSSRPSSLCGRKQADIHHGTESLTPLTAESIGADQLPFSVFRLQLCGGPYLPLTLAVSTGRSNTSSKSTCRSLRSEIRSWALIQTEHCPF